MIVLMHKLYYPDKLIKRDFTLPDRSGTGRGPVGDREEACYVAR